MSPRLLADMFDSVVMLTWSDWKTEPRSNRYHYASRFAKTLPVFFVQPDSRDGAVSFEHSGHPGITIVHAPATYGAREAILIVNALRHAGARRPLLWVYNVHYEKLAQFCRAPLKVYHATEDYVSPIECLRVTPKDLRDHARNLVRHMDLVVAVSEGVANAYRKYGDFRGEVLTLKNGCDYAFWRTAVENAEAPTADRHVAFYQGGINQRLDYGLLIALAKRMPDWDFVFCGSSIDAPSDWRALTALPNVRYLGALQAEELPLQTSRATVGLIPFVQGGIMRRSLPLKAYEYAACGLPVVSIPIDDLAGNPHVFTFASDAEGFARALDALAPTRNDPTAVAHRLSAAAAASYDSRFAELETAIARLADAFAQKGAGEVLILYDDRSTHVRAIAEHLDAFGRYSRHRITYMPATGALPAGAHGEPPIDLDIFDAVLIHFSVRLSMETHLAPAMARALTAYDGPKILFIQDEYDTPEIARRWIERLELTTIYSVVPDEYVDKVYPRARFPRLEVLPTLTGYVPEDPHIELFACPLEERAVLIGYRGRKLPHQYGELGHEKWRIGVDVRRFADARGLLVDIESDDARRIYGDGWYRFVGACRAVLGTESGCNVFDDDGAIASLARKHADLPFEEFARRHLRGVESHIRMNQISPKVFEAIKLRTALVLFEGEYSGVVKPDEHYIPLKKDYSNIDDVFAKVQDLPYLRTLTARAHRDVVESGRYTYRGFVEGVDGYIGQRLIGPRRPRSRILRGPSIILDEFGGAHSFAAFPAGVLATDSILDGSRRDALLANRSNAPPRRGHGHVAAWTKSSALGRRLGAHLRAVASEPDGTLGGTPARRVFRLIWRAMTPDMRGTVERQLGF